jgi:hypothetical protein
LDSRDARHRLPATRSDSRIVAHHERAGTAAWDVPNTENDPCVIASPKLVDAPGAKTTQASGTPLGAITTAAHGALFSVTSTPDELTKKRANLSPAT